MIGFEIKQLFFDRQAVISRVDPATRKVLSKFGAFVRRTAKGSIRNRKAAAPPGSPPSSHTGLLKKFIFFGYDPQRESVVIGPTRLDRRGQGEAPSLLEHGGQTTLVRRANGNGRRTGPGPTWDRLSRRNNRSCPPCGGTASQHKENWTCRNSYWA